MRYRGKRRLRQHGCRQIGESTAQPRTRTDLRLFHFPLLLLLFIPLLLVPIGFDFFFFLGPNSSSKPDSKNATLNARFFESSPRGVPVVPASLIRFISSLIRFISSLSATVSSLVSTRASHSFVAEIVRAGASKSSHFRLKNPSLMFKS